MRVVIATSAVSSNLQQLAAPGRYTEGEHFPTADSAALELSVGHIGGPAGAHTGTDIFSCLTNVRIFLAVLGQSFLACSHGNHNGDPPIPVTPPTCKKRARQPTTCIRLGLRLGLRLGNTWRAGLGQQSCNSMQQQYFSAAPRGPLGWVPLAPPVVASIYS